MKHSGGCHCGNIKYEVTGTIKSVVECNCSICCKNGFLLWFVPRTDFKTESSENEYSCYSFGKKTISHNFCKVCGTPAFSYGDDEKGNSMVAINIRSLDNIDLSNIETREYDGLNLL